jgi:hypothetical protein
VLVTLFGTRNRNAAIAERPARSSDSLVLSS